jgi:hypothetical protein
MSIIFALEDNGEVEHDIRDGVLKHDSLNWNQDA